MKKLAIFLSCLLCGALLLAACTPTESEKPSNTPSDATENVTDPAAPDETVPETVPPTVVNVAALKGPTGIGLVQFMDAAAEDTESAYAYDFAIEAAADAITGKLIKGQIDIAALPANLASVLYNNTNGEILALDINTLGVLYIVENGETVQSAADLAGKTIYSAGKGSTPEYALNYMLSAAGLTVGKDVFVEFKAEHSECVAAILSESNAVAMLPQPFVTTAQAANENIRIALDLTEEWENASENTLITGVTVVRKAFAEEHPDAVADFLTKHYVSAKYVTENVGEAAKLVEKYGIFKADIAEKAIPYCSIVCIDSGEMKTKLSDYLTVLYRQNPAAVGGKLPDDAFYYGITEAE